MMTDQLYNLEGAEADDNSLIRYLLSLVSSIAQKVQSMYGEMILTTPTPLVLTNINTWYDIAGFTAGDLKNFTVVGGKLVAGQSGDYAAQATLSLGVSVTNEIIHLQIVKNGVAVTGHSTILKINQTSDIKTATMTGVIAGVVAGDVFNIQAKNVSTGGTTLTFYGGNISLLAA